MKYFYLFFLYPFTFSITEKSPGRNRRVINGELAEKGQFPYMVSLQTNFHICGGGIIADQYILTGAHCVLKPDGTFQTVRLNAEIDTLDTTESKISIQVIKIYLLKEYNKDDAVIERKGDIAVLKLEHPIGLTEKRHLMRLELPRDCNHDYAKEKAILAGFGCNRIEEEIDENRVIHYKKSYDGKLRFTEYTIVSNEFCEAQYEIKLNDTKICGLVRKSTEFKPISACRGDSGGPLVQANDTSITVIGVSNTGPIDGKGHSRGALFAKVSSHIDFIENALNDTRTPSMRIAVRRKGLVFDLFVIIQIELPGRFVQLDIL